MRRRAFVKASASAAAGLVFVKPGSVYGTPANDAVAVGIIGCGGRGNAVGQEMVTAGARVVALHDLFDDRLTATRERFDKTAAEKDLPKIADGMLFKGPEAYHRL
ncbi:MAG TPA: gfo/Idh/MocA family oxidoreductase, partial [Vicinamibacteria bacterium]